MWKYCFLPYMKKNWVFLPLTGSLSLLTNAYHGFPMLYWRHLSFSLVLRPMLPSCMTLCTSCPWASSSFPRWRSAPCSAIATSPGASGPASWAWLKRWVWTVLLLCLTCPQVEWIHMIAVSLTGRLLLVSSKLSFLIFPIQAKLAFLLNNMEAREKLHGK